MKHTNHKFPALALGSKISLLVLWLFMIVNMDLLPDLWSLSFLWGDNLKASVFMDSQRTDSNGLQGVEI